MFVKRNFSIINDLPTSSTGNNNASPAKRMRLLSSTIIKTPTLFQESRSNSIERSPIFRRSNSNHREAPLNGTPVSLLGGRFSLTRCFEQTSVHTSERVPEDSRSYQPTYDKEPETRVDTEHFERPVDLHDQTHDRKIETPPPTPSGPLESKLSSLEEKKELVLATVKALDLDIEKKLLDIKEIKEKMIELQYARFKIDDYIDIANKCQAEVRNSLNDIYNPGCDIAKQVSTLIEECKENHHVKYEKLSFEMNQHFDKAAKTIDRKTKEVEHKIKLSERTLLSLETQKRQTEDQRLDEDTAQSGVHSSDVDTNNEREMQQPDEDDCVIIDDTEASCAGSEVLKGQSAQTPESRDAEVQQSIEATSKSETTATCASDEDEETDIEEPKDEDERSFTPCQAQRPKAN